MYKEKTKMKWPEKISGRHIHFLSFVSDKFSSVFAKTSFKSSVYNKDVILEWKSKSSLDNICFYLERKKDDSSKWENIAFLDNDQGFYNSTFYHYDFALSEGEYNYRLKRKDISGSIHSYALNSKVVIKSAPVKLNDEPEKDKFKLYQNYPDLFKSKTIIKFELPMPSRTKLTVFDEGRREVTTLVDEILKAGTYKYKLPFSKDELRTGLYYYQLKAYGYSEVKQILCETFPNISREELLGKKFEAYGSEILRTLKFA